MVSGSMNINASGHMLKYKLCLPVSSVTFISFILTLDLVRSFGRSIVIYILYLLQTLYASVREPPLFPFGRVTSIQALHMLLMLNKL